MEKHREIPWPRILAEGVAIVVSILLAFSIEAWWQERHERIVEQEYLVAVLSDIDAVIAEVDRSIAGNVRYNESGRQRLAAMRDGAQLSDSLAESTLSEMRSSYRVRANLDSYTDLLSSGGVTILRDPTVRTALAKLRAQMDFEQQLFLWVVELGHGVTPLLHESMDDGNLGVIARLEEDAIMARENHNTRKVEVRDAAIEARDAVLAAISTSPD